MALTLEDGSIVPNADTYVEVSDLDTFAAKRGVTTLPATDAEKEVLIIKAMDFVESLWGKFKGEITSSAQELSWPRQNVYINGYLIADNSIPSQLKDAVCQLAIDAITYDLQPIGGGRTITKEKVDVIEVEYAARGATTDTYTFNKARDFLSHLLISTAALRSVRV